MKFKRYMYKIIIARKGKKHTGFKIRSYYKSKSGYKLTIDSTEVFMHEIKSEIYQRKIKKIFGLIRTKMENFSDAFKKEMFLKNEDFMRRKIIECDIL